MKNKYKEFLKEYNQLSGKICVVCLEKQFDKYIGDRQEYDAGMMGNTMVLDKCDRCGSEENGILPHSDINRAIRASLGGYIHPLEGD